MSSKRQPSKKTKTKKLLESDLKPIVLGAVGPFNGSKRLELLTGSNYGRQGDDQDAVCGDKGCEDAV